MASDITYRKHGRWRLIDWLWLGLFVQAIRVFPVFRRRYLTEYVTVSVVTSTIYTPDGEPPGPGTIVHERHHIAQRNRDGLVRFALRYLGSQRWRVRYEAEAYRAGGTPLDVAVDSILEGYFIFLRPATVYAIAQRVYTEAHHG